MVHYEDGETGKVVVLSRWKTGAGDPDWTDDLRFTNTKPCRPRRFSTPA